MSPSTEIGRPVQEVVDSLGESISLYEGMAEMAEANGMPEASSYRAAIERARSARDAVRRMAAAASATYGALGEAADIAAESESSAHAFEGFFDSGGEAYEARREVARYIYGNEV